MTNADTRKCGRRPCGKGSAARRDKRRGRRALRGERLYGGPRLGLITARQLAGELGCSMRTVHRRIAAGDLPRPFKIGGIICWRRRVLDVWLAKKG